MRQDFAGEAMRTRRATKVLAVGVLAVVVTSLFGLLLTARPAYAKTFTVNITGDPAPGACEPWSLVTSCSLREAIFAANSNPGADAIAFNILGTGESGVHTLTPDSSLPPITGPVTIDGYTQRPCSSNPAPCSKPNKNSQGAINASLLIALDGSDAGSSTTGLIIDASNTVIRGLAINSFSQSGIRATVNATGIKVRGSFIGTDTSGISDLGNGNLGVSLVSASGNTVGGATPAARNLISGNASSGIFLGGSGNKVEDNLIGTQKNGTSPLANGGGGVAISGNNNVIGGAGSAANVIARNGSDGVHVFSGTGNRILSNSIYNNVELGIDLSGGTEGPSGITLNDPIVDKDKDTGPNGLQNYPWLNEAKHNLNGTTTIKGTLNSRPEKTYTIQFFSSDQGDPDGFGEGQVFLGQKKVETNKNGNAAFTFNTTLPEVDDRISATATAGGGTSEFAHWIDQ
jgi:CSLREA domain-containing protein